MQQGQLDPRDARALGEFVLAVLRAHPHLSWVSYDTLRAKVASSVRVAEGREERVKGVRDPVMVYRLL